MELEDRPNRLIHEASPYLRQHARNPVDWYPWGSEAIDRARREDRPIFLSIGYSACHWCHVMEAESFENPEIAALMNELFINIKVDREEHPDLDRIYMTAVQMITGSGGWPMSVFLTPDLKPFHGGTYFPPEDRGHAPGFPRILRAVAEVYRTRRDDVERTAAEITAQIRNLASPSGPDLLLGPGLLDAAAAGIASAHDPVHGGFGGAPKFPQSQALRFLLRQYKRTERLDFLGIVRSSLDAMAAGGIYDHLGGGFHRYSTDERWLVPHFEKMLYDQALLSITYLEAFQVADDPAYARVARETLDYLLREMTAPEGGFYSSEDADDAAGEGFFYTWTLAEVRAVLDEGDAGLLSRVYDVDDVGSFDGRSVLHRLKSNAEAAAILGGSDGEIGRRMDAARSKLLDARARRPHPARDGKVLADWNGLAITSLARGSRVLSEPRYLAAAGRAADFLLSNLVDDQGRLLHVWTDGAANIPGFLADHACLLSALIDLYEASGEARRLAEASRIASAMIREFWDEEGGAFCDTGPRHGDLIARTRHAEDASAVSGSGMAAFGLIRLARITSDAGLLSYAERTLRIFARAMEAIPLATGQLLLALDLYLAAPQEIVLAGSMDAAETRALRRVADRLFLPHALLLHADGAGPTLLAGLRGKVPVDGRPAAYVCSDFTCRAPVTEPEDLAKALRQ
jgi:uncharacterized protein